LASTKRISYKVFSIVPFTGALHEQNEVELKKFALFIGRELNDPVDELQAAKNRSYWSTAKTVQPDKRADYKATLEVSEGEGRSTREVELIWWPDHCILTSPFLHFSEKMFNEPFLKYSLFKRCFLLKTRSLRWQKAKKKN